MQISSDLLLGREKHKNACVYEGLLIKYLQPVLFIEFSQKQCYCFQQFGNDFFRSSWSLMQEKSENIIKSKKASHKVIKNEEIEFLMSYNEIPELTFDFLHTLAKEHTRCTFVLTVQNLKIVLKTIENFTSNFKHIINTQELNEDESKKHDNYIFTLSIHSIENLISNFKNKKFDGVGISIEILNKQYTEYYEMPKIAFGYYLLCTNNYSDVLYRDCVRIFPERFPNYGHILNKVSKYEEWCTDYKKTNVPTVKSNENLPNTAYISVDSSDYFLDELSHVKKISGGIINKLSKIHQKNNNFDVPISNATVDPIRYEQYIDELPKIHQKNNNFDIHMINGTLHSIDYKQYKMSPNMLKATKIIKKQYQQE